MATSNFEQFKTQMDNAPAWGKHPQEPDSVYHQFREFWLAQKGKRTVRRAIDLYDTKIIREGDIPRNRPAFAKLCNDWYWRERSVEFDEFEYSLEAEAVISDIRFLREERMRLIRKIISAVDQYLDREKALASANAIKTVMPGISSLLGHLRQEETVLRPTAESNRDLEQKITVVRTEQTGESPDEFNDAEESVG